MNILDKIVDHKRLEIQKLKRENPLSKLAASSFYGRSTNDLCLPHPGGPGIIAEFKRQSPSKGIIHAGADPLQVASAYREAGVSAMSVLTDSKFFGGSQTDLNQVRRSFPDLPLLRKDFIVDSYQLHESSALGADLVLLIAAILERGELEDLAQEAASLGLRVLLEVHEAEEMEKYHPSIPYMGVNNRDLKSFKVDTGRSLELIGQMPEGVTAVSESGLSSQKTVHHLWNAGFKFFLMGEAFMREEDPGEACKGFISSL